MSGKMDDKAIFYFYGNWRYTGGYIGEPQRTLQLLMEYFNKRNNKSEILSNLTKVGKAKGKYKIFKIGRAHV